MVGYADVVHSVDRARLVDALSTAAVRAGRELGCLIQVALDAEAGSGGARAAWRPAGSRALADRSPAPRGCGSTVLMTVAPLAGRLRRAPTSGLRAADGNRQPTCARAHPAANMVSAGMSADLEEAVAAGATHVRVGTAVLGVRPGLR